MKDSFVGMILSQPLFVEIYSCHRSTNKYQSISLDIITVFFAEIYPWQFSVKNMHILITVMNRLISLHSDHHTYLFTFEHLLAAHLFLSMKDIVVSTQFPGYIALVQVKCIIYLHSRLQVN